MKFSYQIGQSRIAMLPRFRQTRKRSVTVGAIVPLATSAVLAVVPPSAAATFAGSSTETLLTGFSQTAVNIQTSTDTNTIAIAQQGQSSSSTGASGIGLFASLDDSFVDLATNSTAQGTGNLYSAQGNAQAKFFAYNFDVAAQNTFTFTLDSLFKLGSSSDNPRLESAQATSRLLLGVYAVTPGHNVLLDRLNLFAQEKDNKAPVYRSTYSSGFSVASPRSSGLPNSGDGLVNQLEFMGSYDRLFSQETQLRLVGIQYSDAKVRTVPEPNCIAALGLTSVLVICRRRKKQKAMLNATDLN